MHYVVNEKCPISSIIFFYIQRVENEKNVINFPLGFIIHIHVQTSWQFHIKYIMILIFSLWIVGLQHWATQVCTKNVFFYFLCHRSDNFHLKLRFDKILARKLFCHSVAQTSQCIVYIIVVKLIIYIPFQKLLFYMKRAFCIKRFCCALFLLPIIRVSLMIHDTFKPIKCTAFQISTTIVFIKRPSTLMPVKW